MDNRDKKIIIRRHQTPIGEMVLGSIGKRVCLCDWADDPHLEGVIEKIKKSTGGEIVKGLSETIERLIGELEEYFAGERKVFDLPLAMFGSEFQMRVWETLLTIPYGTTISYGEEARRVGNPKAVRAVAGANSRNGLAILVPCHRVVESGGKLGGYTGGTKIKDKLLGIEGVVLDMTI